ncbi:MAG TPA: GNAT family N-acetyltransferase [Solirubrobacteraceae bacterium]|jgi:ribosomal protein S18 acetylase RimI-like enzyme|nr:GNAT family N-acetyltransferase [Solirubrobacteraceae bacterium]
MPDRAAIDPSYRVAGSADAPAVARLHAESWSRNYRGAYSDEYLDGDVFEDREQVWSERLRRLDPDHFTLLAEADGELVGFAATIFDENPDWGALVNNLHVSPAVSRRGIGRRLLGLTATALLERPMLTSMYLWVLEQNGPARAFYEACGGVLSGRSLVPAPGGVPARLHGTPAMVRYVWLDPAVLLG